MPPLDFGPAIQRFAVTGDADPPGLASAKNIEQKLLKINETE